MPILGIYASSMQPALNASSYESISTVTVGAGGASTISFTSIPGTYKHLQLRGIVRATGSYAGGYAGYLQFNSDTGSNYAFHELFGDGATAQAYAQSSQTFMRSYRYAGGGLSSGIFGVAVIDILDYANTNKYKVHRTLSGFDSNSSSDSVALDSGLWMSTAAITTVTLVPPADTFAQYSTFALYGIKGA